jgi:hypothetical protein
MADESERIHESIVATRQDLEDKLELLRHELRRKVDVRRQIAERPWLALGGSLVVGFTIGALTRRPRRTPRATVDGDARSPLAPRALLTHVGFALLSGAVHEIIDRHVPKLVARIGDRMRDGSRDGEEEWDESVHLASAGAPADEDARGAGTHDAGRAPLPH